MVHLSKLCCYSNIWLWVRLNFVDVLNMERYPLFSFFLFLRQKLRVNYDEMACDNNQYFEFQEMQLNWSIYRAKIVLINWLIDRAVLALFVYFYICELTFTCYVTYVCQQQLQLFLLARIIVHLNWYWRQWWLLTYTVQSY